MPSNYGHPARIPTDVWDGLEKNAATLTRVRDAFYKERGQKPPDRPMSRMDALREVASLGQAISSGQMLVVAVDDLKDGSILETKTPLTEFIQHFSVLSALGLARHLGHEIRYEKNAAGYVDLITIDGDELPRDVIHTEANNILHEVAPQQH